MKLKAEILIALAALCGAAFAADPVKETEKGAAKSAPAAAETDEIDLDKLDDSADAARKAPTVKLASPAQTNAVAEAVVSTNGAADAASPEIVPVVTGLVDIECDDATLADILRQFRKTTGANIISADSSNLQQRVSVSLKHVPWLDALQAILNSKKFRLEPRGDIYFVGEDKRVEPVFTRTFALNHASAKELAELFNTSLNAAGPKDAKTGKPKSGQIATAFEGANVVVVTASETVLTDCEQIIRAVDKAIPQIYIEARFVELSNEAMHKLGLQWNQLESWGASVKNLEGGFAYNNGRPANYGTRLASSSASTSSAKDGSTSSLSQTIEAIKPTGLGSGASSSSFGRSVEDMSWRNARGFSGQLSADDFHLAMSAFESMSDVKIFSNPKIIVSNGKEAMFDRTTKFPNVTLTSQHEAETGYTKSDAKLEIIPGEDGLFSKSAFFSWGITLVVKPRISPDGLISVEITPSISELNTSVKVSEKQDKPTGFYQVNGGTDAPYGSYPILLFKRLKTEFTMKDGATAVIGGLSKTEEEDIDSGIPYLRKIPWIGPKLFGWKSRGKVQTEILIFVTVGIADPANLPEDVGLPKNAVYGREYIQKRAFEPGDRTGGPFDIMSLDMRAIEERRTDGPQGNGSVTITPVVESNR